MELLAVIALGVIVYQLWRRIEALEQRLREVELRSGRTSAAEPVRAQPPHEAWPAEAGEVARAAREFAPAPGPAHVVARASPAGASGPKQSSRDETKFLRERFALPKFDFEDLFGRLLPIWAGGITLAVAGFFIVRYSIESGLLTPSVRVTLGFLFGLALLGAAEGAYRIEQRLADPRVRQALAGAGLATLYASFYLAGSHYGLIGPAGAFVGLAAVTAGAIGLAGRFGLPCAVLGLVGGFAAPLLVGGEEAQVPLLAAYLGLVTGGLMVTSRQRRWAWLGLTALGGGLVWGALLLASFGGGRADILALGALLIVLGVVLPALAMPAFGPGRRLAEAFAAGVAALQMAVLVGAAEFSMLSWGLLGLLAGGLAWLGWNRPGLRRASAFAALTVPLLLSQWEEASAPQFALVTGGLALILSGVPTALVRLARQDRTDVLQVSVATLGLFWASWYRFGADIDRPEWLLGLAGAVLALLPLSAAFSLLRRAEERARWSTPLLFATAYALLLGAGLLVTPIWAAPLVAAGIGGAAIALGRGPADPGLAGLAWGGAAIAGLLLLPAEEVLDEFARTVGSGSYAPAGLSALRWAMPSALFAGLATVHDRGPAAQLAGAAAAVFGYAALAQLLPPDLLAWSAALLALAALIALPGSWSVAATFAAIAAAWALAPLGQWLAAGTLAVAGEPLLVTPLPPLREVALRLLPLVVAAAAAWVAYRDRTARHWPLLAGLGTAAVLVPLHIAFKHGFALASSAEFERLGLSERTVWQALLLAIAFALTRIEAWAAGARVAAGVLGAAALLHWTWFSLLLHNPLVSAQAVGALPVLNLLTASYGLAIAALIALRGPAGARSEKLRVLTDGVIMVLIGLLAISLLRQAFTGTYLVGSPVSPAEDLLRSLTGIVLAVAFLAWGALRRLRSWRIGSLVLMVLAVLKVFLVDAADLQDLARIASFAALGFTLIGIGWFYARQLRSEAAGGNSRLAPDPD
jgi:uncharacterized membrane protein